MKRKRALFFALKNQMIAMGLGFDLQIIHINSCSSCEKLWLCFAENFDVAKFFSKSSAGFINVSFSKNLFYEKGQTHE